MKKIEKKLIDEIIDHIARIEYALNKISKEARKESKPVKDFLKKHGLLK